jgi:quercetin dioxygenase-like cupin family protein
MPFKGTTPARIGGAIVTFEPGARTAWHTHPLGQTLIVTSGLGWVQTEGGPKEDIRAGDIVWIPPGEKHWHGATNTTAMTHIAIAEQSAAEVLANAGYEVSTASVDVSSRDTVDAFVRTAIGLGGVTGLIHAAGVSPSQASPDTILKVDVYGTALVLEEFGNIIAAGGAGVV